MNKYRFGAMTIAGLLASGLMVTTAQAADFGGDCCADLEERIAELEATTARKGNRKVSLTVSGFVAQQVLFWDDGEESNVYVTDTGSVSIGTNFSFSGKAQITPDVSAGFLLKIEAINADSLLVSQDADDGLFPGQNAMSVLSGGNSALAIESAYWYLKSETLGRLSVGQQSSAADNQAILVDGSGSLVQANYVLYDSNAFFLRRSDNGAFSVTHGSLANCQTLDGYGGANGDCDGVPHNNVRYDTPVFAGFSASASWGEDDIWGVSGRYAGTLGQFKLAAAVAYTQSTDETGTGLATMLDARANGGLDVSALQTGAFIMHNPTGLFAYGAYARDYNETTNSLRDNGLTNPEGEMWYVKAGIRQKWNPFGATTLYGEFGQKDDQFTSGMYDAGVNGSELTHYGVGIVQDIDAAAMSMWLAWRGYDADISCDSTAAGVVGACNDFNLDEGNTEFENLNIVKFGALIAF